MFSSYFQQNVSILSKISKIRKSKVAAMVMIATTQFNQRVRHQLHATGHVFIFNRLKYLTISRSSTVYVWPKGSTV